MNKKLGRALRPGHMVYLLALVLFSAAAVVMEQYVLGAVGFGLTMILLIVNMVNIKNRNRSIQNLSRPPLKHRM